MSFGGDKLPAVKILGREIQWSEQLETRALPQITDIGIAFATAQAEIQGGRDTALPAVYRSVQLLTDLAASLPLESIGSNGIANPLTPELLSQPDPREVYNSTLRKIMASLLLRGNAYLRPIGRSDAGLIRSVQVLNPDEVQVAWDRLQMYPEYVWRDIRLERNVEIFPISINYWPGHLKGVGPIEAARLMFYGMKAEANMARRIFEDDATPAGVIEVPRALTKPEAEEVQTMWEESHGGRKRPAVLSGGVTFHPITINPVDAQFIEQRNFSVQEVARMFGLDGWFLNVESGSSLTYTNTESLGRQLLTMTLNPTYLEPIEQVFSLMLPIGERARFNTDEILQADMTARYTAYQVGLDSGFLTIDDVREKEGLAHIEPSTKPQTQEALDAGS